MLSAAIQLILSLAVFVIAGAIGEALIGDMTISSVIAVMAAGAAFVLLERFENERLDNPRLIYASCVPEEAVSIVADSLLRTDPSIPEWHSVETSEDGAVVRARLAFFEPISLRDGDKTQARAVDLSAHITRLENGCAVQLSYRVESPGHRLLTNAIIGSTTSRIRRMLQARLVEQLDKRTEPQQNTYVPSALQRDLQESA